MSHKFYANARKIIYAGRQIFYWSKLTMLRSTSAAVSLGKERGLLSPTVAGNQAYFCWGEASFAFHAWLPVTLIKILGDCHSDAVLHSTLSWIRISHYYCQNYSLRYLAVTCIPTGGFGAFFLFCMWDPVNNNIVNNPSLGNYYLVKAQCFESHTA